MRGEHKKKLDIDLDAERWYTKDKRVPFTQEGRGCLLMDEPLWAVKRGNCLRNPILLGIRR